MPTEPPPIPVALVEDDHQVRVGLRALINRSTTCRCPVAFGTAEDALAVIPSLDVRIVLMDLQLPGMSGIDGIRTLKRRLPRLQIVVLTVFEDHERIFQALAAGASGYLRKQIPEPELANAIVELHRGGATMSTQIARRVAEIFANDPADGSAASRLDPREHDVVSRLAQGFLPKEVSAQLGIGPDVLGSRVHGAYQKLHARCRVDAAPPAAGAWPRES